MKTHVHTLPGTTPGLRLELTANHFGAASVPAPMKVYVQAALHADEIPAMLVAQVLRERLTELEAQGRLRAEVVLVGCANPLGLSQAVLGSAVGRFELSSGSNFNRGFLMPFAQIAQAVEGRLGSDAAQNARVLREAWRAAIEGKQPATALEALQNVLLAMAHDADIVLDLHCSKEAAMHLYTSDAIWDDVEPLARFIGSKAHLLALDAGGQSFDEALSYTWYQLREKFGAAFPIPRGPVAVTVEHRGQRDVSYEHARRDAAAIVHYLAHMGAIEETSDPARELPPLLAPATPLAGSEQLIAPSSGVLVYRAALGDKLSAGSPVFDIVDPVSGRSTTVHCKNEGVFYMGRDHRFVRQGDPLGRVSGTRPIRTGKLLSA